MFTRRLHLTLACTALLLMITACSSPPGNEPGAGTLTVSVSVSPGALAQGLMNLAVPSDPDSGLSGMHDAVLTVYRGDVELHFDAAGRETPSPGDPLVLESSTGFTTTLTLMHGEYLFHVVARDENGEAIADGETGAPVPGSSNIAVALRSLIGAAILSPAAVLVPGELIDVSLTVLPFEGSALLVPTTEYTVDWTIEGGVAADHLTSHLGARVRPSPKCEDVAIFARVIRNGESEAAVTVTRSLDTGLYCAGTPIGITDTTPPELSVNPVQNGSTLYLTGEATDNIGVTKVEIYDGPVLLETITFTPDQRDWAFPLSISPARTYNITVIATDLAGNQATVKLEFKAQVAL